jgi:hypothetical protein
MQEHQTYHNALRKLAFSAKQIERAVLNGNGIVGATKLLNCSYRALKQHIDELGLDLIDGRETRHTRPEQRQKRQPYKGHTDYVKGYISHYNHIIKRVAPLTGLHPVYDLEIEGSPNFVANELSFDYGQIQARNVAMESLDKALIKAFWDRYDIHQDWMERISAAHPSWMPKDADKDTRKKFRHRAKNEFVFPSFFGAQPKSLSRYLSVPINVVTRLHTQFWDLFPDIKAWHERILKQYSELGYVAGLSGFRRHAPASPNEIINAPIQADEAAIVCDAMTRLSELGDPRLQANMEIHDDLTFLWRDRDVD